MEELIFKLPINKRIEWAKFSASIQPYPNLKQFSEWVSEVANYINIKPSNNAIPKILIGLDNCQLGSPVEANKFVKYGPITAKTVLGWVIFGPTKQNVIQFHRAFYFTSPHI